MVGRATALAAVCPRIFVVQLDYWLARSAGVRF